MGFGYLTVTVDMTGSKKKLTVSFLSPGRTDEHDSVVVSL